MARINPFPFLCFAIVLGACASLSGQTDESIPSGHVKLIPPVSDVDQAAARQVKEIPAPVLVPKEFPFSIDNPRTATAHSIQMLSESEMSREDRDLLADAESSIQERAGFENLEFEGEGWTYHELVCPALPKHMFLRFTRDDGTRQMSMFSVAIPRNGNGRVHIIPIVRRGYSLFSPAPIGALTIAAFNRVRAEEGDAASADWLGTGLCYAALAGANPKLSDLAVSNDDDIPSVFPPTLTITAQGGAVIHFADVSATPKPMEWTMSFDPKGKLIKADHSPSSVLRVEKLKSGAQDTGQAKP